MAEGWILLQTALQRSIDDMRGRTHTFTIQETPQTFETLLGLHGSTAEIATAAGYGAPGQWPKGSPQYARRETFMRSLRRYRQGTRSPNEPRARLFRGLVAKEQRRRAAPVTHEGVIGLMAMWGLTVVKMEFQGAISEDDIERDVDKPGYWISPTLLTDFGLLDDFAGRHWKAAVPGFTAAFSEAWVGDQLLAEITHVRDLQLNVGRYEYRGRKADAKRE